tara:strand:+ start:6497 stop:7768 length:1272 start_codon:yes stop_codon:yes gene_type:complete
MTEILKILIIYPIFLIFIFVPFPVFNKINNKLNLDLLTVNLIINCNILLFFSLTGIKIKDYQSFLILFYILIFLFYLIKFKINPLKIKTNFIIFYFCFFILGCVVASELNFGWDAKYFYYIKSLFFYEGLGLNELSKFEHNKWHPHLGSYFWAFFWSLPFFEIEYFGRFFYLFIFCFSIYFVTIESNKNVLFNYTLFLTTLLMTFNYERFSGLQEVLIFSFLIISAKILYDIKISNRFFKISLILMIANLILWIKSEGIVYAFFLITILMMNKNISIKEKIFTSFIFLLLILFKNFVFSYYNFELISQPYNFAFIKLIDLNEFFYRLLNIIIYGGYYSLKNILFLIGIFILIKLYLFKNHQININNFVIFFILNILFIIFAYTFRDMEIIYSLKTTLERIIFTSSAFYIYLIILYINQKFKIN